MEPLDPERPVTLLVVEDEPTLADAVAAVDRLPEPLCSCALAGIGVPEDDGLAGWNLGRERARTLLSDRPFGPAWACTT